MLLHEISHGLGPAYRKDGTEVAKALGSYYSALEETKADTGALFLILKAGGRFGIENMMMKYFWHHIFQVFSDL